MKIINKSRKIICINGEPFLPGETTTIADGSEKSPAMAFYFERGLVADASKVTDAGDTALTDLEKARIADEAVERYKAEQAAAEEAKEKKEAEIKAVQSMKKQELLTKAAGMGLEVKDDDTVDALKEKIVAALSK